MDAAAVEIWDDAVDQGVSQGVEGVAQVLARTELTREGAGGPSGSGTQIHKHFNGPDKFGTRRVRKTGIVSVRCCRACLQREVLGTEEIDTEV